MRDVDNYTVKQADIYTKMDTDMIDNIIVNGKEDNDSVRNLIEHSNKDIDNVNFLVMVIIKTR